MRKRGKKYFIHKRRNPKLRTTHQPLTKLNTKEPLTQNTLLSQKTIQAIARHNEVVTYNQQHDPSYHTIPKTPEKKYIELPKLSLKNYPVRFNTNHPFNPCYPFKSPAAYLKTLNIRNITVFYLTVYDLFDGIYQDLIQDEMFQQTLSLPPYDKSFILAQIACLTSRAHDNAQKANYNNKKYIKENNIKTTAQHKHHLRIIRHIILHTLKTKCEISIFQISTIMRRHANALDFDIPERTMRIVKVTSAKSRDPEVILKDKDNPLYKTYQHLTKKAETSLFNNIKKLIKMQAPFIQHVLDNFRDRKAIKNKDIRQTKSYKIYKSKTTMDILSNFDYNDPIRHRMLVKRQHNKKRKHILDEPLIQNAPNKPLYLVVYV